MYQDQEVTAMETIMKLYQQNQDELQLLKEMGVNHQQTLNGLVERLSDAAAA